MAIVEKEFKLVVGEGAAGTGGVRVHNQTWTETKARSKEGRGVVWNRREVGERIWRQKAGKFVEDASSNDAEDAGEQI